AHVKTLLGESHPDEIERSLYEADHVARAFAEIDLAGGDRRFDLVHDHCGFTALAMADRLDTPLVHTLHGQFTPATAAFYARHGHKAALVGISAAQLASAPPGLPAIETMSNPIDLRAWPLEQCKQDYLLWIGRITAEKGPHRAIRAARAAGMPLVLAGVVQPRQQAFFDREVAPHLDGERVRFVGEVAGEVKRSLFANARALLMPIRWNEPFGMVMVEALACGTPVIAFPEGAARELVIDARTGFLGEDEPALGARSTGCRRSRLGIAVPGSSRTATSRWLSPPTSASTGPWRNAPGSPRSRISERTSPPSRSTASRRTSAICCSGVPLRGRASRRGTLDLWSRRAQANLYGSRVAARNSTGSCSTRGRAPRSWWRSWIRSVDLCSARFMQRP